MSDAEAFLEWRASKLSGSIDLSFEAYKVDVSKEALAWEAGALTARNSTKPISELIAEDNPFPRVSETKKKLTS